MDEYPRPNPDELLQRVQSEEAHQSRGRLKVFLGYAAGVGKTYAMLEAARQRMSEGMDVVAAYVETHHRAETEAMLSQIECMPLRMVDYKGTQLAEVDVDALLKRRPQIALLDELAHTNAPGSRFEKRYMDVEELLTAGINVYTTLNIQHLESLNDVVAQVTGVVVRERVPDSVLDNADEIELVDLPPAELVLRLQEGKVYVPDQAARAVQQFFRLGNLNALRELALRRAADRVDHQMRDYMVSRAIPGPWSASERLLVCVSPSELSERLVHTTRRLADEMKAEWRAIYVETPAHSRLSEAARSRVARTLALAEELSGRTVSLPGQSVAETVVDYARKHNITKIVAGKPERPRWKEMLRGSVFEQIVRLSGNIDVYVVSGETAGERSAGRSGQYVDLSGAPLRQSWNRYVASAGLIVLVTLLDLPLHNFVAPNNLVMFYLLGVVIAALYLGRGPAALSALLSVLFFDFFFVPPQLSFAVSDTQHLLTFVGLLVVGLVISNLTARAREQAAAARRRETQAVALYELSRDLASADDLHAIVMAVLENVSQVFERQTAVLLAQGDGLEVHAVTPGYQLDEKELAVADWAFRRGVTAGHGTTTLPDAEGRYLPLLTARGTVGVLGVRPDAPSAIMLPEQRRLLEAFASQAALAIERALLADHARHLEMLKTTEQLQSALLNSVSHELRTPLVAITGTLSALEEDDEQLTADTRRALAANGRQQAERLNHLVGNLLDMSRIEAGAVRPKRTPTEPAELISAALDQLGPRLGDRKVVVVTGDALPAVSVDAPLTVQALMNVVENAHRYSPSHTQIDIAAHSDGKMVEITVSDRGPGIPLDDRQRVFDKFYRIQRSGGSGGTGMGLAISKGLIEAQDGWIWAATRPGGGAAFTLALPIAPQEGPNG
jgi:two-component system, OmpR family, sensor histidine kinase KdpD